MAENKNFARGHSFPHHLAVLIAIAAGQGSPREGCGGNLFSEDLWNDADDEMARRAALRPQDIF